MPGFLSRTERAWLQDADVGLSGVALNYERSLRSKLKNNKVQHGLVDAIILLENYGNSSVDLTQCIEVDNYKYIQQLNALTAEIIRKVEE